MIKSKRDVVRLIVGVLFILIGTTHFTNPAPFVKIVPPFLTKPLELVYISGFFEMLGGLGLLFRKTQQPAAYGMLALIIAVYPANIYHAFSGLKLAGVDSTLYHIIRLPLQPILGWLILWCGKKPKQE